MEFNKGLSDFKHKILDDILDKISVNVKEINYLSYYVFPIGYQADTIEKEMNTEIILADRTIGLVGMGENGETIIYDFDTISEMKTDNNKLKMILFGGLSKVIIEMPDENYATILYDAINLGRQGYEYYEITQKIVIDSCIMD